MCVVLFLCYHLGDGGRDLDAAQGRADDQNLHPAPASSDMDQGHHDKKLQDQVRSRFLGSGGWGDTQESELELYTSDHHTIREHIKTRIVNFN